MWNIFRILIVIGSLVMSGCGGGSSNTLTVEINGDSILFGPNLTLKPVDYIKQTKPDWIVVDKGVLGLTMRDLVNGYQEPFLNADHSYYPLGPQAAFKNINRDSKFVVLGLGGNDALTVETTADFEAKLRSAVTTLLSENRIPILTGIIQLQATEGTLVDSAARTRSIQINAITYAVAADFGLVHAQWDKIPFDNNDTFDGIHRKQGPSNALMDRLIIAIQEAAVKNNYVFTPTMVTSTNNLVLGTIDYSSGGGAEALLALVNKHEGINIRFEDVTFLSPQIPTEALPVRNTKVRLAPKATSGFYGVKTIWYNRIHIASLGSLIVPQGTATKVSDLLPAINVKYGIYITPSDIIDGNIGVPVNGQVTVNLNISNNSLVFYGGATVVLGADIIAERPIVADTVLFGNEIVNYQQGAAQVNGNMTGQLFDQWSMVIDVDQRRKVVANLPDINTVTNATVGISEAINDITNPRIENTFPFVFTWYNTNGKVRGITPMGDTMEMVDNGELWQVISTMNLSNTYAATIVTAKKDYANSFVFKASRSNNGILYALVCSSVQANGANYYQGDVGRTDAANLLSRKLFKSTDNGTVWQEVIVGQAGPLNISSEPLFEDLTYQVKTYIDFVVKGETLYLLSGYSNYSIDYHSQTLMSPVLEMYNLVTNQYVIYSLNEIPLGDTDCRLSPTTAYVPGLLELKDDYTSTGVPEVIVYGKTNNNFTPVVVRYYFYAGALKSQIVNTSPLNNEVMTSPGNFVQGYSIPLQNHSGMYLEVIEITHPVLVDNPDFGKLLHFNEINQESSQFYGFGQYVYTCIRNDTNNTRTKWIETKLTLESRYIPSKIELTKYSNNVIKAISQNHWGLSTKSFTYSSENGGYVPTLRKITTYDNITTLNAVCGYGVTKNLNYYITELASNLTYNFTSVGYTKENTKPAVHLSFSGYDTFINKNVWWNIEAGSITMNERVFSKDYEFITKDSPAFVASDGQLIYAGLTNGSIISSSNFGRSWVDFSRYGHIGKPKVTPTNAFGDCFGVAKEKIKAYQIVRGGLINSNICLQFKTWSDFNIYAKKTDTIGSGITLQRTGRTLEHSKFLVIPRNKTSSYDEDTHVYNSLNPNGFKRVMAWDFGVGSYASINTKFQHQEANSAVTVPRWNFNEVADTDSFQINPTIQGEVIGLHTNMQYLNIRYAVLTRTPNNFNNEYHINFVRTSNNTEIVTRVLLTDLTVPIATDTHHTVSMHVWDGAESNFVPFIISRNRTFYSLARLEQEGNFRLIPVYLSIPGDNTSELKPIPMLNANRLEYYYMQRGNAIFRIKTPPDYLVAAMLNNVVTFNGQILTFNDGIITYSNESQFFVTYNTQLITLNAESILYGSSPPLTPPPEGLTLYFEKVANIANLSLHQEIHSGCEVYREDAFTPAITDLNVLTEPSQVTLNNAFVYTNQILTTG